MVLFVSNSLTLNSRLGFDFSRVQTQEKYKMHATTEICSNHTNHHSTFLGQVWDRMTHKLATQSNEIYMREELLRKEKEFQLHRMARRTADLHRMVMKIV